MNEVTRPVMRYHGGKWRLAPWIISHFPAHRIYVEPYGGAASVLLRKPRSYAEVYNDLDGEVVNVFRVLRNNPAELERVVALTPFAREEYLQAWHPSDSPVEQARRTIIRSFMGFGSAAVTLGRSPERAGRGGLAKTGFRAASNRLGTTPAHDWTNWPDQIGAFAERLSGVVIENRDAFEIIEQHDSPETLHFIDPPYMPDTRDAGGDYAHEMSEEDHGRLANALHGAKGMVVLCGYPSDLYADLFDGWTVKQTDALADGARKRTECLWMNRAASSRLTPDLWDHVESD